MRRVRFANGTLPANIVEVLCAIVRVARREGVGNLQQQLDYSLRLVSWSWIARECRVQLELIDAIDAGATVLIGTDALLATPLERGAGNTTTNHHIIRSLTRRNVRRRTASLSVVSTVTGTMQITHREGDMKAAFASVIVIGLFVAPGSEDSRQAVTAIVAKIRRADYEGNRPTLKRLHAELARFVDNRELASSVLYWRGFALWRSALNGFNDSAHREEIEADLTQATVDFRQALSRDSAFADAKVGAASCLINHAFLNRNNAARARELAVESERLLNEAMAVAPDNPRLLWVLGANQWYRPPERGGGQSIAMATYERGLKLARRQQDLVTDSLEPTWGEPELLMNLAFANLNRSSPNLAAAEQYAQSALALVPYWHYVRDILTVQIKKAKADVLRRGKY